MFMVYIFEASPERVCSSQFAVRSSQLAVCSSQFVVEDLFLGAAIMIKSKIQRKEVTTNLKVNLIMKRIITA